MSITHRNRHVKETTKFLSYDYREQLFHAFEFLKDSQDWLVYKKAKGKVDNESYIKRLQILINMAMIYFYSVYEGFTRCYFKTLVINDDGITEKEFDRKYRMFYNISTKLMKERYGIVIPDNINLTLKMLHEARNKIVHESKNTKPDFEIVIVCYQAINKYIQYLEDCLLISDH